MMTVIITITGMMMMIIIIIIIITILATNDLERNLSESPSMEIQQIVRKFCGI
jgi:hypothetical protein